MKYLILELLASASTAFKDSPRTTRLIAALGATALLALTTTVLSFWLWPGDARTWCTVSGKVSLSNNQPLTEGFVVFQSNTVGGGGSAPVATDGTFHTGEILAGSYSVHIEPPEAESKLDLEMVKAVQQKFIRQVPTRMWSADTSGLTVEVTSRSTRFDIALPPATEDELPMGMQAGDDESALTEN